MNKNITIAIDGQSSTGKSTIAKIIAKELNYVYVDTGAMYRAVTLYAINNEIIGDSFFNKKSLISDLDKINLSFTYNPKLGFAEMHLNNINIENEIRKMYVSKLVSYVASLPEVRRKLVAIQQEIGKNKGIVMDGRDIGTVVFPEAELKIFMTAAVKKRATRRYKELKKKGDQVNFEAILENVIERDHIDSTREDSPLIKASDAIEIDNSDMEIKEQFKLILTLVNQRIKR